MSYQNDYDPNNYGPNNYNSNNYQQNDGYGTPAAQQQKITVPQQVNAVMKRVYLRMFLGLIVSALVALAVASVPSLAITLCTGVPSWILFIGILAMAIIIPVRLMKMRSSTVIALFLLFCALMGASLSGILLIYTAHSIVATFFVTAGLFGAMSVYGYFTKRDLTGFGTFLFMALIGVILASLVNMFLHSDGLSWIISIVGVLVFVGLTAWDTQWIKRMCEASQDPEMTDKLATYGAMNLYLDFINLFLYLLRFFGGRD